MGFHKRIEYYRHLFSNLYEFIDSYEKNVDQEQGNATCEPITGQTGKNQEKLSERGKLPPVEKLLTTGSLSFL